MEVCQSVWMCVIPGSVIQLHGYISLQTPPPASLCHCTTVPVLLSVSCYQFGRGHIDTGM